MGRRSWPHQIWKDLRASSERGKRFGKPPFLDKNHDDMMTWSPLVYAASFLLNILKNCMVGNPWLGSAPKLRLQLGALVGSGNPAITAYLHRASLERCQTQLM